VTIKRPEPERKDEASGASTRRRRFVPLKQLALSPQCGFSSIVEGQNLTRDQQVANSSWSSKR
jgi:5-methyltetrahydropteroyltriglutamate--homocysteine methyltransferase